MPSQRLDQMLVKRNLVSSRAKAQSLIEEGQVQVDGQVTTKCSRKIADDREITIIGNQQSWVGRGALKLIAALEHFQLNPSDMVAADIGASTGGFSEVLLRQNVSKVYAVDVGHDQLHPSLRKNSRLINLEGFNARTIDQSVIPDPLDLVVSDVSFISLKKALPATLSLCKPGAWLIALIKPQFEAGRAQIGKGGVIRNPSIAQEVRTDLVNWINDQPAWRCIGSIESPITGSDGNQEFLMGARYEP